MTPTLRGLKSLYPDANIYLLTFEENQKFCRKLGYIDQILTLRADSLFAFAFDVMRNLMRVWSVRPNERVNIGLNYE